MAKAKLKTVEALDEFVERLTEERGITDLEPDVLAQLRKDLKERVERRLNAAIIGNLPPHKLDEFEDLLDDNATEKKVQDFCHKHIADLDQLLASELINFRVAYLSA